MTRVGSVSRAAYERELHVARADRYGCRICGEPLTSCAAADHEPSVSFEAFVHVLALNGAADFEKADLFQIRYTANERGIDMRDASVIAMAKARGND